MYRDMTTTVSTPTHILGVNPIAVNYGDFLYPYALYVLFFSMIMIDIQGLSRCKLCPEGTFKAEQGDDEALCRACPSETTTSTDDRRSCACFRLAGGQAHNDTTHRLHFDGTECLAIPRSYRVSEFGRLLDRLKSPVLGFTRIDPNDDNSIHSN